MAEEAEKQEGQKTVVAFIAGLLIGGLLVWVFSSSPEEQSASVNTATEGETTQTENTNGAANNTGTTRTSENVTRSTGESNTSSSETTAPQPETVGDGELVVGDQGAGSQVLLSEISYPTNAGWIAVRDYADGVPGRILGAARYNLEVGLLPTEVNLLRNTESGMAYQVVFYTEDGDGIFDLANDTVIEGMGTTFTAQ